MRITYWTLGFLALFILVAGTATATHFRYGTLSWEPTGNPGEVRFTGGQAWRTSYGWSADPVPGAIINGEGCLSVGDGACEPIYLRVNARSNVNDWFTATFVDASGNPGILHTYASPNNAGAPWVASWASCCRISQHHAGNFHANNPDQSERLETRVDLAAPPNSSPKSSLPPINSCPQNALCTIVIPRVDAEEDPVTFRLSSSAEAGDASYHIPGAPEATNSASIGATTGILTWDTNGATISTDPDEHTLYSIQLMLEDGRTKTPLDFFLEILPIGVTPPRWVQPPTPCGETLVTGALQPFTFDARAVSDDGRNVLMANLGLPAGASLASGGPANPVDGTFTWTPTLAQVGTHLVVLTAEDDRGYAAPPCPITIKVVTKPFAVAGPDRCVKFGSTITLDGSQSGFPMGYLVDHRWDFPHGASPVHGAIIQRTLNAPADLVAYTASLTVTGNDSQTATDTLRLQAYNALGVAATTSAPRYTPFQRPHGDVAVSIPCGASIAGASVDLTVTFTTHDATLDATLLQLLGPEALVWETSGIVAADGKLSWRMPFSVAERYALPLGLLNPTSQLLILQGDYVVEAGAAHDGVTGLGSTTFDVVLDHQFPIDEVPTASSAPPEAVIATREEAFA